MNRTVVIGTSGCGKTTLGKKVAKITHCEFTDLDDLFWLPEWTPRSEDETVALIKQTVEEKSWVIAGNYTRYASKLIWPRADLIIWLDIPLHKLLWRSLKRTARRIFTKEACCNGNYESLSRLLSSKSILWWVLTTYHRRKKAYSKLFLNSEFPVRRISNAAEYDALIRQLSQ